MLAEVGVTVDRERRPEVDDRPRELGVDRDVPERRPPRPGLPGGHAVQPAGSVVRAEQHDGRREGSRGSFREQSPSGRGDEHRNRRGRRAGRAARRPVRRRGSVAGARRSARRPGGCSTRCRAAAHPPDRRTPRPPRHGPGRRRPVQGLDCRSGARSSARDAAARCGPGPGPLEVAAGERASAVRTGTDGGEVRADPVAVALDEHAGRSPTQRVSSRPSSGALPTYTCARPASRPMSAARASVAERRGRHVEHPVCREEPAHVPRRLGARGSPRSRRQRAQLDRRRRCGRGSPAS